MDENLKILKDIKNELVNIETVLAGGTKDGCTLDKIIKTNNEELEKMHGELARKRLNEISQLMHSLIIVFPQNIPSIFLKTIIEWNYLKTTGNTKNSRICQIHNDEILYCEKLCTYKDLDYFLTTYQNVENILTKIKENEIKNIHIWEDFFNCIHDIKSKNIDKTLTEFFGDENIEL